MPRILFLDRREPTFEKKQNEKIAEWANLKPGKVLVQAVHIAMQSLFISGTVFIATVTFKPNVVKV